MNTLSFQSNILLTKSLQMLIATSVLCVSKSESSGAEFRGGDIHYWQSVQSGSWFDPQQWNIGQVPNSQTDIAIFDLRAGYTARIGSDVELARLEIQHDPIEVSLAPGARLRINSELINSGRLTINDQSSLGSSRLVLLDGASVNGPGRIWLGAEFDPYEATLVSFGGVAKISQSVVGSGVLLGRFNISSGIYAEQPNHSGLIIDGRVVQSSKSEIRVRTGDLELLEKSAIIGGNFELRFRSRLILNDEAEFEPDELVVGEETTLDIRGTHEHPFPLSPTNRLVVNGIQSALVLTTDYINDGEIVLNEDDESQFAKLLAEADSTISGNGLIDMRATLTQRNGTLGTRAPCTLTIGSGQSIFGTGSIYGDDGGTVVINTTVRTSPGGFFRLQGNIAGGSFIADAGHIAAVSATITNAQFRTENGGVIVLALASLTNPVFVSDTPIEVQGSSRVRLYGSVILKADMLIKENRPELVFESGSELIGSGEIVLEADDARLTGELTIPSTITVSGYGRIDGTIFNNSVVSATNPLINLSIGGIHQGGVYVADMGVMRLGGRFIDGEYIARGGSLILAGGTYIRSHVYAEQGGDIRIIPGVDIDIEESVFESSLDLCDDTEVTILGTSYIDGVHQILDRALLKIENGRLEGSGTILMRKNTTDAGAPTLAAVKEVGYIGPGYTIRGSGVLHGALGGTLIIEGDVIADDPFAPMALRGNIGPLKNLTIDGGSLTLEDSLRLIDTQITSTSPDSVATARGAVELVNVENQVQIQVPDRDSVVFLTGELINNGRIVIDSINDHDGGIVRGLADVSILGNGTIELRSTPGALPAGLHAGESMLIGPGQRIEGDGRIAGKQIIQGVLAPGGESRNIQVGLTEFTPESTIEIDISGPGISDFISVHSGQRIHLDGTLDLLFEDGYAPNFGDRWVFVEDGNPSGAFRNIQTSVPLPSGWAVLQLNHDDGVDLMIGCPGDRNGDGVRDFADAFHFIADYANGFSGADLNLDGEFDYLDISMFIQRYQQECQP